MISKPSLKIEIRDTLRRQLRLLGAEDRKRIGEAINHAAVAWGSPHLHAGAGIRKLPNDYFECRAGLRLWLVFERFESGTLIFSFLGSHDEVQRFIKSRR